MSEYNYCFIHEKYQWDPRRCEVKYPCKYDQMCCLTQEGWKSPFHACANMFGNEAAYDLLIDYGGQLNLKAKHKMSNRK